MAIIESNIAGDVKMFEYAKNHHYLRLRDNVGNETTMVEHGLVKYECASCTFVFFTESHQANCCPRCNCRELAAQWTRPQVSLVPEQESDFAFVVREPTEPTE